MVFWPKLSLRVQKEKRSQKHFLFGPKVSELGPNLALLARQENALIFILRLHLRRTFSFHAFSYNAYFHSPPSPTAPIFIPCPLLLRLFIHRVTECLSLRLNWAPPPTPYTASKSGSTPGPQDPSGLTHHWQTHLPSRLTCPTPLLYTQVQYPNAVLEGAMQRSLPRHSDQHGLASHLVRAPNSRSGGHEFESPMLQEFGALTKKVERPVGPGLSTNSLYALLKYFAELRATYNDCGRL